MTAILLPQGKQFYTTAAGAPLVGGKVYTYYSGTATPLATYADAAQVSANANPTILDARGEASIYWNGVYKVVLKDSVGNTVWTADPVSASAAGVTSVTTIAAMVALPSNTLTNGQSIYVAGYATAADGGGGNFVWVAASTAASNTGTIFQSVSGGAGRWLRTIVDEVVNVLWFGADPTGGANSSTACQNAYNYATSSGGLINRRLYFPSGYYNLSINLSSQYVNILGAGFASTQLRPATTTGTVFTMTDVSGATVPMQICDLTFAGQGTRQGIGILHTTNGASSSGRELVERCTFTNLDMCVKRGFGDFLAWYRDCFFETANYHIYTEGASYAHGGDILIEGGHIRGAVLASLYLDSTTVQTGKFVVQNVTIEGNPGYVVFVKNANVGAVAVPSPVFSNCWNENNATSGSITVGGVTAAPVWGYFSNTAGYVGNWLIQNSPPGPMTLSNYLVNTRDCDLSFLGTNSGTTIGTDSSLTHDNAKWTGGFNIPGIVNSATDVAGNVSSANIAWVKMAQLIASAKVSGATVELVNNCSANSTWSGTATTNATDSGIAGLTTCQDLAFAAAGTKGAPDSGAGPLAVGRYLAWVWVGKLQAGTAPTLKIGGGFSVSLTITVPTDFTTLKGMTYIDNARSFLAPQLTLASGTCTVRMAGWAILSFGNKRDCLAFLNSNMFPT